MTLSYLTRPQVAEIIALADDLRTAFPLSLAHLNLFDPADRARLEAYLTSSEHVVLVDYITALSLEQQEELKVLMWVGRGRVRAADFGCMVNNEIYCVDTPSVVDILEMASSLPRYLTDALSFI